MPAEFPIDKRTLSPGAARILSLMSDQDIAEGLLSMASDIEILGSVATPLDKAKYLLLLEAAHRLMKEEK